MREQGLVDLEQGPFIVDEQVKDVGFVSRSEVADLDTVLRQLGQPEQTLFELFGFFTTLVELLELLSVVDLVFEAPFHYLFAHFFDALDEQGFELVAFCAHINFLGHNLLLLLFFLVDDGLEVPDCVSVARLKSLDVLHDLFLHVVGGHAGLEDQVDKLLKLHVPGGNISVATPRGSCRGPLTCATLLKDFPGHHL